MKTIQNTETCILETVLRIHSYGQQYTSFAINNDHKINIFLKRTRVINMRQNPNGLIYLNELIFNVSRIPYNCGTNLTNTKCNETS